VVAAAITSLDVIFTLSSLRNVVVLAQASTSELPNCYITITAVDKMEQRPFVTTGNPLSALPANTVVDRIAPLRDQIYQISGSAIVTGRVKPRDSIDEV
jgi:hypothetical protein